MPEDKPRIEQEKNVLSWKAPARPFKYKDKQVMTVPIVIAILAGIIMIIAGEWVIIALIVAMIFAYYMWSTVPPEEAEYLITNRGIRMHGKAYPWEILSRWWIEEKEGQKLLMLETPVGVVGRLVIPLGKQKQEEVEKVMEKYVFHEKPADSQLDKAGKWLATKFPIAEKN